MNEELASLDPIDLRDVWSDEARDFTPWLAEKENLAKLGRSLGLELEPVRTEFPIGRYSADIVCNIVGDENALVLIENQLSSSDHVHLGQTLTYAAELEPVVAIWIAESFTDEHKKSLNWMNDVTHGRVEFFAVTVNVWKIERSKKAPQFNVVVHPSNWSLDKNLKPTSRRLTKPSALQKLQRDFWTCLRDHLDATGVDFSKPTPQPLNSLTFATGRTYFQFLTKTDKWHQEISVALYLTGPEAQIHFDELRGKKEKIEEAFGETLDWYAGSDDKAFYITHKNDNSDLENVEDWDNQVRWFTDTLTSFNEVFRPIIQNIK